MGRVFKLGLASGLGSGLLPFSPGTWGSLLALVPIYWILQSAHALVCLSVFIVICCVINLWVAPTAETHWGEDPGHMVIDEWAGQSVAFLGVAWCGFTAPVWMTLLVGFIFFRVFDIAKPLGVYQLQKLPGGWGILADDLLAGVYGAICLQVALSLSVHYIF